jgi:hypothetical protein
MHTISSVFSWLIRVVKLTQKNKWRGEVSLKTQGVNIRDELVKNWMVAG